MLKQIVAVLCGAILLAGCGGEPAGDAGPAEAQQSFRWKLVTSWPKNYPGLDTAPEEFARMVNEMSGGRLQIKVYGAGELVPALEVFDAVSRGTAEMGHSAAYYWKGKHPATTFFTTVPFGLNAQEMNAWVHYGGGLELWREVYAPFNLIPFAGGSTGVQMAGWFNREINSVEDLRGLKIRIPGIGGEVISRLGAQTVNISGGELYTSLQTNVIDATDWVGPYNDLAFGFHQIGKYYYYPGWHEPGSILEFTVNKDAYESLPGDLQAIIEAATRAVSQDMFDLYTARNKDALADLVEKHGVELRAFPPAVLARFREVTAEVLDEVAASDPLAAKVHASQEAFKASVMPYHKITEEAFYEARRPSEPPGVE